MYVIDDEGRKKEASNVIQTTRQSNTTHPTCMTLAIKLGCTERLYLLQQPPKDDPRFRARGPQTLNKVIEHQILHAAITLQLIDPSEGMK